MTEIQNETSRIENIAQAEVMAYAAAPGREVAAKYTEIHKRNLEAGGKSARAQQIAEIALSKADHYAEVAGAEYERGREYDDPNNTVRGITDTSIRPTRYNTKPFSYDNYRKIS